MSGADPVSADGQPGHGRVAGGKRMHDAQPGHRQGHDHPATGVKKPTDAVTTTVGDTPKTKLVRKPAPPSHHRMRTEGTGMHVSGQPGHGPSLGPGSLRNRLKATNHVTGARTLKGGLGEGMGNLEQARVGKYGSAARFKKLLMTPKTDGGSY